MLTVIKHVVNDNIIHLSVTAHACTIAWCVQQFNSCCAKLSTSLLLSYGPNRPELNSINYKI